MGRRSRLARSIAVAADAVRRQRVLTRPDGRAWRAKRRVRFAFLVFAAEALNRAVAARREVVRRSPERDL